MLLPGVAALCWALSTLPAKRARHPGLLLPGLTGLCRALPCHHVKALPSFAGLCRDESARQAATHCRALPGVSRLDRALPRVWSAPDKTLANWQPRGLHGGLGANLAVPQPCVQLLRNLNRR